jgi:BolA protein
MSVAERIRAKLAAALAPTALTVIDESHRHAGHIGARPEGETHFQLDIVSEAFAGRSRLERHRLVHGVLAEELAGPVHALSLRMRTPAEADAAP